MTPGRWCSRQDLNLYLSAFEAVVSACCATGTLAQGAGLEPTLTASKAVVLPITQTLCIIDWLSYSHAASGDARLARAGAARFSPFAGLEPAPLPGTAGMLSPFGGITLLLDFVLWDVRHVLHAVHVVHADPLCLLDNDKQAITNHVICK